ncbi:NAC domain-containing protein 79-like [Zingiber officinale]|uniref:NAC domain-containing protein n=1 Tax=Zingiber officinale TaxID=94328 RepID=A0A8J5GC48_ZINOF|nr:NAC domain-containing protein 79-like [Zingiber officinale]KAG6496727.1 hypothetical protein ZIOFF_044597 [Zingiber officinale]
MEEGLKDQHVQQHQLPPGFRFHPTDEELIAYYLTSKTTDADFDARAIAEVDLNKCEPWDLPEKAKMGEKEWYFYSLRDRKYPTGLRTNRATNAGYWKTTGKDKEIFSTTGSSTVLEMIGMKKTLVFYKGRAPRGEKTNWVMHEYRIHSKSPLKVSKNEWVVCRIFAKSASTTGGKKLQSTSNHHRPNPYYMPPPPLLPSVMVQNEYPVHPFALQRGFSHRLPEAELTELSRFSKATNHGGPGGLLMNMPMIQPSQGNCFPGGGFAAATLASLNLNLGGAAPPPQMLPHLLSSPAVATNSSGLMGAMDGGFQNNVESGCLELEGFWPSNY